VAQRDGTDEIGGAIPGGVVPMAESAIGFELRAPTFHLRHVDGRRILPES
jgi:hypothetical protein